MKEPENNFNNYTCPQPISVSSSKKHSIYGRKSDILAETKDVSAIITFIDISSNDDSQKIVSFFIDNDKKQKIEISRIYIGNTVYNRIEVEIKMPPYSKLYCKCKNAANYSCDISVFIMECYTFKG